MSVFRSSIGLEVKETPRSEASGEHDAPGERHSTATSGRDFVEFRGRIRSRAAVCRTLGERISV
jgi:hypothetical protein